MTVALLQPGTVVGREFVIERELGSGGMGSVFVALQRSTGVRRALKVMRPEILRVPRMQGRFDLEARVGASIPSDHVVQVITAGIDEALGIPYLAMELLEGEGLDDAVKTRGPMARDLFRVVFEQLCHAIGAAHKMGVIHRDLKPENIFLANPRTMGTPCVVKVLDFGIAKIVAEAKTQSTAPMGTPLWMAPEQTAARAIVTSSTDVWALGLIAFYCLTGRSYWTAAGDENSSAEAILREMLIEELVPASRRAAEYGVTLPSWFDVWFGRCVHRSPESRFADASALWSELRSYIGTVGAPIVPAVNGIAATAQTTPETEIPATQAWTPAPALTVPNTDHGTQAQSGPSAALAHQTELAVSAPDSFKVLPPSGNRTRLLGMRWGVSIGIGLVVCGAIAAIVSRPKNSNGIGSAGDSAVATASTPVRSNNDDLPAGMVLVPAASFLMGDASDSKALPVHRVTIPKPFFIDKFEVTVSDYQQCLARGTCTPTSVHGPDVTEADIVKFSPMCNAQHPERADHPVNCLDRSQATTYCSFVGKRLPTEAEWEFAARGTDGRIYPWGNDEPNCDKAVVSGCIRVVPNAAGTKPVGSFPNSPSPFGALDMAGNVWEWVSDDWDAQGASLAGDLREPGVLRGGSWDFAPTRLKSFVRQKFYVTNGHVSTGFRCAKDAEARP